VELTYDAGSWSSYVLVFLAAATPVVEILVVIPTAVLAGMAPVPVTLVALAGNLSTVVLVPSRVTGAAVVAPTAPGPRRTTRRTATSARALAQRYGVPGLALLAPITTGTHIATVAALATGASSQADPVVDDRRPVGWAVAVAVVTVGGLAAFG
jgi:Ca2+/H+ antiporter, TMEM165/GDT1 family